MSAAPPTSLLARRAGARLVHVSTIDALGLVPYGLISDEETPIAGGVPCTYVVTKREAEQAVLAEVARGLAATIVNPAFVIGPWDWTPSSGRMLLVVAHNRGVMASRGTTVFCDARDVAQGILAAADRGAVGRRYILGGQRLTYVEAFRIFAKVTHSVPPLLPAGPRVCRFLGACGDLWTRLTGSEPDLNSATMATACQFRNFATIRAERELDYHSRPLVEAAEAAWHWFREHQYA